MNFLAHHFVLFSSQWVWWYRISSILFGGTAWFVCIVGAADAEWTRGWTAWRQDFEWKLKHSGRFRCPATSAAAAALLLQHIRPSYQIKICHCPWGYPLENTLWGWPSRAARMLIPRRDECLQMPFSVRAALQRSSKFSIVAAMGGSLPPIWTPTDPLHLLSG